MSDKIGIRPLRDKGVVERDETKTETASGLVIPESAKQKPVKGIVRAVGLGTKEEPMLVKVGDVVLYGKHSGSEIELDGKPYLVMLEKEIYAVVD